MLELFTTAKYDDRPVLKVRNEILTIKQLKELVAGKIEQIKKLKQNVVILSEENYDFIINFFAAIFSDKNIYLVTEKQKLKTLSVDFDIIDNNFTHRIENYAFPYADENKQVLNFYTSGSTFEPKCIKKSLSNIIIEAIDDEKELKYGTEPLIVKSSTTLYHMFGITFHLFFALCNGHIIDTERVLYPENLDEENCLFVSSPAFLHSVKKHNLSFKVAPKYIVAAGSKLDNGTYKYLENCSSVTEIYGSTETGSIAYRKHYYDEYLTLLPGIKFVSNNRIITKYNNNEEMELNDNVEFKNNKIKITGRKDRLLKIYDKRVSLEEIETKLKTTGMVKQVYCFKYEEKLASICALTEKGKEFLIKNGIILLQKKLKKSVEEVSDILPQKWRFCDELPVTQTGKINKEVIHYLFNVNFSFPVILDKNIMNGEITYKMFFYKNANFYKGHFPNFPITPGVVQLYVASELIKYNFNSKISSSKIKKVKFTNIILPNSIVQLNIMKSGKSVIFSYCDNDKIYSSGEFPLIETQQGE